MGLERKATQGNSAVTLAFDLEHFPNLTKVSGAQSEKRSCWAEAAGIGAWGSSGGWYLQGRVLEMRELLREKTKICLDD